MNKLSMDNYIEILKYWSLNNPKIVEQYNKESTRIILKISDNNEIRILKGIPDSTNEEVIIGNVSAHKYMKANGNLSPGIYTTSDGLDYIHVNDYWFYLMEYIDGKNMTETVEDQYCIGGLARKLHSYKDYNIKSSLDQRKERFYDWFREKEFKSEFDNILDSLPEFELYDSCFIHTDLSPHNAMRRKNEEGVLIDLDDAGIGCRYLDLGWPFIMQYVDFNHQTGDMRYRFDLAKAFLKGYYGDEKILKEEYDLIWYGAIQMHISYMQCYGPYAVDSLWKILNYGILQKEVLWQMME